MLTLEILEDRYVPSYITYSLVDPLGGSPESNRTHHHQRQRRK
jgi:hypothetical protein